MAGTSAIPRPILGLDIGGTKLAAGVLGTNGRLLSWERTPSIASEGPAAMLQRLTTLGLRSVEAAGLSVADLAAVGVGCGGPLDADRGIVLSPPNLPGWEFVPVADRLRDAFGLPVCLDNDANAGALGEAAFGAGRGACDIVFLTISTGVGGGVVSNGRLLRGASGNAAELGHLCVVVGGRRCGCGARGCLEAYASGTSIALRAREAIEAGEHSLLVDLAGKPELLTAETVAAGARAGDELACRIWAETIDVLASGVASAIHAFNPELVILGGGVVHAGDLLLEPLREAIAERTMPALSRDVRIVASILHERLGVYGAAAVAGERLRIGPWSSPDGSGFTPPRPLLTVVRVDTKPEAPRTVAGPEAALDEHLEVVARVRETLGQRLVEIGEVLCQSLSRGGRLIAFGNGGSAADAQHFVAELLGRYKRERRALPAIALTTDPSVVTCIANDYGYADVFARQVEGLAGPEDVVVGFSTSGNAQNVVRGLLAARLRGATTVVLTGGDGGIAARVADHAVIVPSATTARIQEMHGLIVHLWSERIDDWAATERRQAAGPVVHLARHQRRHRPRGFRPPRE